MWSIHSRIYSPEAHRHASLFALSFHPSGYSFHVVWHRTPTVHLNSWLKFTVNDRKGERVQSTLHGRNNDANEIVKKISKFRRKKNKFSPRLILPWPLCMWPVSYCAFPCRPTSGWPTSGMHNSTTIPVHIHLAVSLTCRRTNNNPGLSLL